MRRQRCGHGGGKAVAVDRQRAARRHLIGVGGAHDERAEPPHLGVQQADRVVLVIVGAEGIGADQFGEPPVLCAAVVRSGRISCSVTGTPLRQLPGGFGAGEAAADDMDRLRVMGRTWGRAPPMATPKSKPPAGGRGRISNSLGSA